MVLGSSQGTEIILLRFNWDHGIFLNLIDGFVSVVLLQNYVKYFITLEIALVLAVFYATICIFNGVSFICHNWGFYRPIMRSCQASFDSAHCWASVCSLKKRLVRRPALGLDHVLIRLVDTLIVAKIL